MTIEMRLKCCNAYPIEIMIVKGNSESALLLPHIPYATIAACQMGLVPHLTQASPPIYRFRLCDLEVGDLLDMLKMNEMRIKIMVE